MQDSEKTEDQLIDELVALRQRVVELERAQAQYQQNEDISSRQGAESALQTQARVLENMAEGVVMTDENGIIVFTNPAFDRIFGYEPGELHGSSVTGLNYYPPAENDRVVGEILEVLKTEGAWSGEFTNRKKDGSPFTTSATISALNVGGKTYLIAVQEDITARKRMEEALRQSEERYRCLVTATSSIVGTVASNGAIVEDIRSWQDFTGQTPEQYKGFGWLNAVHPDDRQPTAEIWNRAFWNKTPVETEYRLLHYDGEYRHVLSRGVPILDASGNVREWIGTITDVHDQRQAEEKLRQTEAKLMGLFRSGVVGITWGEEDLIVECNDEMLQMVGYTRDELLAGGMNWNEMTPQKERSRSAQAVQEAIETGKFAPFEKNFICKDGSLVPTIFGGYCLGTNPFRYVSFIPG